MEIRKIFKTGNSLVLSLPGAFLKELNLTEGERVTLEVNVTKDKCIIIRPLKGTFSAEKSDFAHGVEDFVDNYKEALDKLEE